MVTGDVVTAICNNYKIQPIKGSFISSKIVVHRYRVEAIFIYARFDELIISKKSASNY